MKMKSMLWNRWVVLLLFLTAPMNLLGSQILRDDFYLFPIFLPLVIVGLWLFTSLFLFKAGGWSKLAEVYRAPKAFEGNLMSGKTISFGTFVNYKGIVSLGANREGLYLEILHLFSLGCPPLFIPWKDMTAFEVDWFRGPWVAFTFAQVPGVTLKLRKKDALDLKVQAGFPDVLKNVS